MNHEISIISYLSKEEKNYLIKKEYKKGDILFFEEDECNLIAIVLKGGLKISTFLLDGNEIIYNYINEGELFGMNLIYSSDPRFKGDVIATKDTKLFFMYKDNLTYLLQSNTLFMKEYLKYQSDFGKKLNFKIKLLSLSSIEEKIEYLFETNHDFISYKSITELAVFMNVKRESLSRYLHSKERTNEIKIEKNLIKKLP